MDTLLRLLLTITLLSGMCFAAPGSCPALSVSAQKVVKQLDSIASQWRDEDAGLEKLVDAGVDGSKQERSEQDKSYSAQFVVLLRQLDDEYLAQEKCREFTAVDRRAHSTETDVAIGAQTQ